MIWNHLTEKSPDYFDSPFFKTFISACKAGSIHPISAHCEQDGPAFKLTYKIAIDNKVETVMFSPNDINTLSTIRCVWFYKLVASAAEKGRKEDFIFMIKAFGAFLKCFTPQKDESDPNLADLCISLTSEFQDSLASVLFQYPDILSVDELLSLRSNGAIAGGFHSDDSKITSLPSIQYQETTSDLLDFIISLIIYHKEKGAFPKEISELLPKYMKKMPASSIIYATDTANGCIVKCKLRSFEETLIPGKSSTITATSVP
jgi:hypothetical protein